MKKIKQKIAELESKIAEIHTKVPVATGSLRFDGVYSSAEKKINKAKAFSLKDVSNYGAVVYLEFGKDSGLEPEQLTKKKVSWSNLISSFFGDVRDEKKEKFYKSEMMKHGLVLASK
jgi:hypothetical protein